MPKTRTSEELAAHFWSKVKFSLPDDCWEWSGAFFKSGYPMFTLHGKAIPASRFLMMLFHVPLAPNIYVCHHCDNPRCLNPKHLFVGTHQQNMDDRHRKGRYYTRFNGHPSAKLRGDKFNELVARMNNGERPYSIAREFGINGSTAYRIKYNLYGRNAK